MGRINLFVGFLFTHYVWIPNMGWISINHIQCCFDPRTYGFVRMFDTTDSSHLWCVFGEAPQMWIFFSELTRTSPKMIVYVLQIIPGRTCLMQEVFINLICIYKCVYIYTHTYSLPRFKWNTHRCASTPDSRRLNCWFHHENHWGSSFRWFSVLVASAVE